MEDDEDSHTLTSTRTRTHTHTHLHARTLFPKFLRHCCIDNRVYFLKDELKRKKKCIK